MMYVGEWVVTPDDCGMANGPQTVVVAPGEVLFPDSRLAVTGVAPDGETAARVDGHFKTATAEWDGAVRLEMAAGGVLNVVNGSTLVPRVKCP